MLLSVAADVRITQLVNGTSRGCHVVLPKSALPPPSADDRDDEPNGEPTKRAKCA